MTKNAFGVIGSTFVKSVHVKLTDEGVHFGVTEVSWKDDALEFIDIFNDELRACWRPECYFGELLILNQMRFTLRMSNVLAMNPAI